MFNLFNYSSYVFIIFLLSFLIKIGAITYPTWFLIIAIPWVLWLTINLLAISLFATSPLKAEKFSKDNQLEIGNINRIFFYNSFMGIFGLVSAYWISSGAPVFDQIVYWIGGCVAFSISIMVQILVNRISEYQGNSL